MNNILIDAIQNKKTISFSYHGKKRVVQPHHLGVFGIHDQIHAYQVNSEFTTPGWKNFIVSSMQDICINQLNLFVPQSTYNPSNSKYSRIYASVLDINNSDRYDPDDPNDSGFQI
ncbi:hypothetical protein [Legionella worsleiensis]|uniref:WYL domain-containing protein n=1 Tax=Legionella worsleiensis TaxID=45076 RepID=A0A0W1A3F5_9GAMM|nr:hypothetical protein [Legionella worsleiensis]KTD75906.1 hypothetical protein Lwor_2472 [Legionella worsleiensis]STY32919.1 Uncharacterised protein [Legionella worsleiensis]